ncbi:MAG: hypothetical protein KatS3mg058_3289 [Roseiflexus sp.]|nr:MAG: hypothetical protein KatS3mg058_3289 [Roseiflexus sp.]
MSVSVWVTPPVRSMPLSMVIIAVLIRTSAPLPWTLIAPSVRSSIVVAPAVPVCVAALSYRCTRAAPPVCWMVWVNSCASSARPSSLPG